MATGGTRSIQVEIIKTKIFTVISAYEQMQGRLPSIEEIRIITGISTNKTVNKYLRVIEEEEKMSTKPSLHGVKPEVNYRAKILMAIQAYHEKHGFSPTVRELRDMVGLRSTATVHRYLGILKKEGKIDWNPEMARTIRILDLT
jgi:repressor LexA